MTLSPRSAVYSEEQLDALERAGRLAEELREALELDWLPATWKLQATLLCESLSHELIR